MNTIIEEYEKWANSKFNGLESGLFTSYYMSSYVNKIYEGLLFSYDIHDVIKIFKNFANIDANISNTNTNFKSIKLLENPVRKIKIKNTLLSVEKIINSICNITGWHISTKQKIESSTDYMYTLLPDRNSVEMTHDYLDNEEYLYHVSPKRYETKILKYGLVPRNGMKKEEYPDRIYFATTSDAAINLIPQLYDSWHPEFSLSNDNIWCLYQINPRCNLLYSDPLRLFADENYPNALYTMQNVAPYGITKIAEYDVNDFNVEFINQSDIFKMLMDEQSEIDDTFILEMALYDQYEDLSESIFYNFELEKDTNMPYSVEYAKKTLGYTKYK